MGSGRKNKILISLILLPMKKIRKLEARDSGKEDTK